MKIVKHKNLHLHKQNSSTRFLKWPNLTYISSCSALTQTNFSNQKHSYLEYVLFLISSIVNLSPFTFSYIQLILWKRKVLLCWHNWYADQSLFFCLICWPLHLRSTFKQLLNWFNNHVVSNSCGDTLVRKESTEFVIFNCILFLTSEVYICWSAILVQMNTPAKIYLPSERWTNSS